VIDAHRERLAQVLVAVEATVAQVERDEVVAEVGVLGDLQVRVGLDRLQGVGGDLGLPVDVALLEGGRGGRGVLDDRDVDVRRPDLGALVAAEVVVEAGELDALAGRVLDELVGARADRVALEVEDPERGRDLVQRGGRERLVQVLELVVEGRA